MPCKLRRTAFHLSVTLSLSIFPILQLLLPTSVIWARSKPGATFAAVHACLPLPQACTFAAPVPTSVIRARSKPGATFVAVHACLPLPQACSFVAPVSSSVIWARSMPGATLVAVHACLPIPRHALLLLLYHPL
eukprot:114892-Pelagomonas_calceolata.AAC.1